MQLCKMAELRKRKWNLRCHLVAGEFSICWQHLISFIMYIIQLYKEDWAILHMLGCRAVVLPCTEQIVSTADTVAVGPSPSWVSRPNQTVFQSALGQKNLLRDLQVHNESENLGHFKPLLNANHELKHYRVSHGTRKPSFICVVIIYIPTYIYIHQ